MNRKQIIVVAIGAVAIAVAFLVPPWKSYELTETDQGQVLLGKLEHRLFNNPPEQSEVQQPHIAWKYAVQKAIAYTVVAGALCYILRAKKRPVTDESQEKPSAAAAF